MEHALLMAEDSREYFWDFSVQAGIIAGSPVVQYVFTFGTESPLPGEGPVYHVHQLPSPAPTEEMIDAVVADSLRSLASEISRKRSSLN